jgi:hypothetical protein
MKHLLFVAAVALIAAPVLAGSDILPVQGVHYGTYNPATGRLTPATPGERMDLSIWNCTADTGWYYGSYANAWTVLDWGDICGPVTVGGFAFAYATDLLLPQRIDAVITFYGDENGFNTNTRNFLAGYIISNLPTGSATFNGWVITVDLEAAALSFLITGNDLDGDNKIDFGYTYWFRNLPAGSATGPFICGTGPNDPPQCCQGCEDAFDVFNDPNLIAGSYVVTYWFGGDPFAQFYMELFDEANDPNKENCVPPDWWGAQPPDCCWAYGEWIGPGEYDPTDPNSEGLHPDPNTWDANYLQNTDWTITYTHVADLWTVTVDMENFYVEDCHKEVWFCIEGVRGLPGAVPVVTGVVADPPTCVVKWWSNAVAAECGNRWKLEVFADIVPQPDHVTITFEMLSHQPAPPACSPLGKAWGAELCTPRGDLNWDGCVTLPDLATLLGNYGCTHCCYKEGDLNCDWNVNLPDLAELLGQYNACGCDCLPG